MGAGGQRPSPGGLEGDLDSYSGGGTGLAGDEVEAARTAQEGVDGVEG